MSVIFAAERSVADFCAILSASTSQVLVNEIATISHFLIYPFNISSLRVPHHFINAKLGCQSDLTLTFPLNCKNCGKDLADVNKFVNFAAKLSYP